MKLATPPTGDETLVPTKSEAELCAAGIAWLKWNHWTVLEEPSIAVPGHRQLVSPDLVIMRNDVVGVVQAKMALTPQLILQAAPWRDLAHVVYVLVPAIDGGSDHQHQMMLLQCQANGLGVLRRWPEGVQHDFIAVKNNRANIGPIVAAANTHINGLPAGSAAGHRSRASDRQWDWVTRAIQRQEGQSEKELRIEGDLTREQGRAMMKAAEAGHISGVRVREVDGVRRLFLMRGILD